MWDSIELFIIENDVLLGSAAAALAIIAMAFSPFRSLARWFRKPEQLTLAPETIVALKNADNGADVATLTTPEFIRIRREMKADLLAELKDAPDDEKAQLSARIAELENQINNPDKALAEAQVRIVELEKLLAREANHLGAERVDAARAALQQGDYSVADGLFAEIEAARELDVQEAARAAYGRGEIAEAEIRWADAAIHFARAAQLDTSLRTLLKAQEFAHWSGDYPTALRLGKDACDLALRSDDKAALALAMNDYAVTLEATGRNGEAEPLFREALALRLEMLGGDHPNYAQSLSNLAGLLKATGRYDEAEPLYREAQAITRKVLGVDHPAYANRLNNLAGLLEGTGRYADAEPLFREALAIRLKVLGAEHPDYGASLNNLAGLLNATGQLDEAEPLYREATKVMEATLGAEHPNSQTVRGNLEAFLAEKSAREQE